MLFKKNTIKTCFCVLSFSLILSSPANALWPFNSTETIKNTELSKEIFENNSSEFELTKGTYAELIANINDVVSQIEINLNDFKNSHAIFVEQLNKLNDSYNEWSADGYTLRGNSYVNFNNKKEQFDKMSEAIKLKKEGLKTLFEKLLSLTEKDSVMYKEYKFHMNKSVDSYYKYGLAVAKDIFPL